MAQQPEPTTITLTIRNVPLDVRDILSARASLAGKSVQEFLLAKLVREAHQRTKEEVLAEIEAFKEAHHEELSSITLESIVSAKNDRR